MLRLFAACYACASLFILRGLGCRRAAIFWHRPTDKYSQLGFWFVVLLLLLLLLLVVGGLS
jgi:hypothetical protein